MNKSINLKNYFALILAIAMLFTTCRDDNTDPCTTNTSMEKSTGFVTKIKENHFSIYSEIIIDASPEAVWSVLTDWNHMPNWSSSLQGISGDITNGGKIQATFLNENETIDFPHVLILVEGERFGWSDQTSPPFDGFIDNHQYIVEKISDCQTRFIQSDEYNGEGNDIFTAESAANFSLPLFITFNTELKQEVESIE